MEKKANMELDNTRLKAVIILVKQILKERRISQVVLAEKLKIQTIKLSDQLFFRTRPDEFLLQRILDVLEIELDIKDKDKLSEYLDKYGYSYAGISDGNLKQLPKTAIRENTIEPFYWKFDPSRMVGRNIKEVRTRLNLSQEEFATQIDPYLTAAVLETWESGEYLPNLTHCIRIAKLGGVSLDWLFTGEEYQAV